MSDMTISFCVLAGVVVLFVSNLIPVELVAIGAALTLYATDVLTLDETIGGFGDSSVVFIATLFVVSEGLDATGVTAWAGQQMMNRVGDSRTRLMVVMMLLVAVLTALISVNGAVAALLPMVAVLAVRLGRAPSQLLMPLAFAAHAGSMLALTGTPVSVIVSEALENAGADGFEYFEFALVGVPLLVCTIAVVVLFGERLLPTRTPKSIPPDLSEHARLLVQHYTIDDRVIEDHLPPTLITRDYGIAEVVIAPRSAAIGSPVFPGMVTDDGDLVVLAIERKGEALQAKEATLAAGDTLLLQGRWTALDARIETDPELLAVDAPAAIRRQAIPLGVGAKRAIVILVAMVVALATGMIPPVVVGLLAAGALVLFRVLSVEQAYRSISWTTVVLVGAMISMSVAMRNSGAAERVAEELIGAVGDSSPYVLASGLFLITAVLGQLISNMATALIVIPIALSAAAETDVSARPLLMTVNVAAAAALLTPVATPVNLMVMGPGGYRFGDYWKLGLPLLVVFYVIAVFLVPVFWPY
ncbi:SLC13 family permease [Desertimonas flava]|jgi:di/tricarboxylate transporter|uniref:SLC13 family permease n=1 Tax=Desertimonas flava TaxID=2064846 RepID=UPI000E3521AF|nr:SLC13 family permease [Desertimonas flava]